MRVHSSRPQRSGGPRARMPRSRLIHRGCNRTGALEKRPPFFFRGGSPPPSTPPPRAPRRPLPGSPTNDEARATQDRDGGRQPTASVLKGGGAREGAQRHSPREAVFAPRATKGERKKTAVRDRSRPALTAAARRGRHWTPAQDRGRAGTSRALPRAWGRAFLRHRGWGRGAGQRCRPGRAPPPALLPLTPSHPNPAPPPATEVTPPPIYRTTNDDVGREGRARVREGGAR